MAALQADVRGADARRPLATKGGAQEPPAAADDSATLAARLAARGYDAYVRVAKGSSAAGERAQTWRGSGRAVGLFSCR